MKKFDAVVIGAGMSGIACALRLQSFGLNVALIEKHRVIGGLNSFFQRVKKSSSGQRLGIRHFDVGLHALTNFAKKGSRNRPLMKILRQLRIPYDSLLLKEQNFSLIHLDNKKIKFDNNIETFISEVEKFYPDQLSGFKKLVEVVQNSTLDTSKTEYVSSREKIKEFISDETLREMIFLPIFYYGSSWEDDIDFNQFCIMFQALYLEGFSRPYGGIRTLFNILKEKMQSLNIVRMMGVGVQKIEQHLDHHILKLSNGETISSKKVFSSIGYPETQRVLGKSVNKESIGKLGFVEVQIFYEKLLTEKLPTICFYNKTDKFVYRNPETLIDTDSAIVCSPEGYEEFEGEEGVLRVTFLANYKLWKALDSEQYSKEKDKVEAIARDLIQELYPSHDRQESFIDTFTPLTVEKYTSHMNGAIYGATKKFLNGDIGIKDLFLIGTDQGYLGITGSILSGISMANMYGFPTRQNP